MQSNIARLGLQEDCKRIGIANPSLAISIRLCLMLIALGYANPLAIEPWLEFYEE
jgi:hypothetical protein